jgi:hypothetical protein
MTDAQRAARDFLNDNYGGITPSLAEILKPQRLVVTKRTISPSLFGAKAGSIEFENADGGLAQEVDGLTQALLKNAVTLASQAEVAKVCIHFDELDQGLGTLDDRRKEMLIGLILAIRSIRSTREGSVVFPVFYMRTDLWDEITFSDKNKISQSSAVFLEWDSDSLLSMVNERIKAKLGAGRSWVDLDDGQLMRGSQSKWGHIVARTFHRPRDVIQFLNCALNYAVKAVPESSYFDNDDIQNAREPYSKYLKQELDDEILPHWDCWAEALQACSELATITFTRDAFREAYHKRKSRRNNLDADEALETLYGFSVVGYRRGIGAGGSGWVFQYADPNAGWDNAATQLKVHPGLKEYAKLREERA